MSRLKCSKLRSVPLALTALKVNALADNGVTQLMVKYGRDPLARSWLKELSSNDHPVSSNVA